jgi:hypothetical protein
MNSKLPLRIRIFDSLVISGFFLSLIPIRLLFIEYIGDNWFGSFGLLTALSSAILILTYKNKLGWFGRSIKRFFRKRHTKKRILMGVHFSISVVMLSTFIYAVNYAEDNFEFEKDEIISLLPQESLGSTTELTQQALDQVAEKPQLLLESAVMFLILLVNDFDKFALALWAVNEIMDGFYMNLATIFLIEEIEVGGLFIIFHIFGRKIQQT